MPHCPHRSQLHDALCPSQALYHGKPILASAFVVDQFPNAAKIVGQVRSAP